jgi:hypothetical protein
MDKNRIHEMIDRKIIESFKQGDDIIAIQNELSKRFSNFKKSLENDKSIDIKKLMALDFNEIETKRMRYGITYIKQCEKRIKDLDLILEKKINFRKYSNSQAFNLLRLKDKLSIENAILVKLETDTNEVN